MQENISQTGNLAGLAETRFTLRLIRAFRAVCGRHNPQYLIGNNHDIVAKTNTSTKKNNSCVEKFFWFQIKGRREGKELRLEKLTCRKWCKIGKWPECESTPYSALFFSISPHNKRQTGRENNSNNLLKQNVNSYVDLLFFQFLMFACKAVQSLWGSSSLPSYVFKEDQRGLFAMLPGLIELIHNLPLMLETTGF